jgi:hypothetical protein
MPLQTLSLQSSAMNPCAHWQLVPMHVALSGQNALFVPHEILLNVALVPQPAGGMSPPLLLPLPPEPVEQLPLLVQPLAIEFMLQHTSLRPPCPGGQHQPEAQ